VPAQTSTPAADPRATSSGWVPPEEGRERRQARVLLAVVAVPALLIGLVVFGALVAPLGVLVAGPVGLVVAIGVAGWIFAGAPRHLLRSLGAEPLAGERANSREALRLQGSLEALGASLGLRPPAVWVLDDPSVNALAIGTSPRRVALVVTQGLLDRLDPLLLEAVLAHELCHVRHQDTALRTVAGSLAVRLAPLGDVGDRLHRICGRGTELRTDLAALAVTRYPPALRDALQLMVEAAPGSRIVQTPAGRATRWLWTALPGSQPTGEALIGELDAPEVRAAALDEL